MEHQLLTFSPILIYVAVLLGFVVTTLVLAHVIGPFKDTAVKGSPYESGMDPIGDARQHFDVKFYLIAVLFLVFDVELVLLYPWAVAAYGENSLFTGGMRLIIFGLVIGFIAKLTIGYAYEWRKGGFKWR